MHSGLIYKCIYGFNIFILYYVVIYTIWQIVQTVSTLGMIFANRRLNRLYSISSERDGSNLIPISIIAPAFNEAAVIVESVKGMLSVDYTVYEVVVVNDGSTDDSLEKLIKEFDLKKIIYPIPRKLPCAHIRGVYRSETYPALTVVDKENGGKKADACNAGINVSRYPYIINIDADCLLEGDALKWVARSFMSDKNCVAVGGTMRMSNGNDTENYRITNFRMPKNWLARFQELEYCRSFLVGRLFSAKIGCLLVISGAFGAFRKEAVVKVGGYSLDSSGEDMDLVMKLHDYMRKNRIKYKIAFEPHAICWTQGPEKFKELRGQRRRWQAGLVQVMYAFRHMLFNPKYGVVGLIGMPYQFIYEFCSPVIEVIGLITMPLSLYYGIITPYGFLLFCLAGYFLSMFVSASAMIAEVGVFSRTMRVRDFAMLHALCLLESFVYRPMHIVFRMQGTLGYGKFKHNWESITRQSFKDTKKEPDVIGA